ncbi:MAG: SDR family NAD(P)-dependent oxidoreductase [Polyangiaceae bacterium]
MVRDRLPLSSGPHWLITGAGRGIGEALAREVRRHIPSVRLSLVDRELESVQRLASELGGAAALACDLADIASLPSLLNEARVASGPIDALVNNAGVMWVGAADGFGAERTEALIDIDLIAPIRLAQLALPEMRSRGSGSIVNVASLAGVTPLRGCSIYAAAKAGIAHYSETLRAEMLPHGINVLTIYPGPVRTQLERDARRGLKASWASRAAPVGEPSELARLIRLGVERRAARVVYPRSYELAWRFPRLAGWITARFSPPPDSNARALWVGQREMP